MHCKIYVVWQYAYIHMQVAEKNFYYKIIKLQ